MSSRTRLKESAQVSIPIPIEAGPSWVPFFIRNADPQNLGPGDEYFGRDYGTL